MTCRHSGTARAPPDEGCPWKTAGIALGRAARSGGSVEHMNLRDTTHTAPPRADRTGAALMLVAGIAFFVGDGLHPKGTNEGDKLAQLHSMLVDDLWYPAHAVLLLAMACFAAGLLAIRRLSGLGAAMTRVLNLAGAASVLVELAMLVLCIAATQS